MFDPHTQRLDDQVKRMFGTGAEVAAFAGTVDRPGTIRIEVDGRLVGIGRTFREAMEIATRIVSADVSAETRKLSLPPV